MKQLLPIPEYTDYLYLNENNDHAKWEKHLKRVEFGRQIMEKWMFVPCKLFKGVWVVLEEPKEYQRWLKALEINEFNYWAEGWEECREYQEAKDRVLFEGFTYHIGLYNNNPDFWFVRNSSRKIHDYEFEVQSLSIEMMVNQNYILALTETGEKQLSP